MIWCCDYLVLNPIENFGTKINMSQDSKGSLSSLPLSILISTQLNHRDFLVNSC